MSQFAALAGRRILLVEDEYLIASEVKRWLEDAGTAVVGPVPSVDRALDLIEDGAPDAAVLDVNLGGGDTAYPIADKLASINVPYLFATGDVKVADASVYRHRPRLEKPFSEGELMRALTQLLTQDCRSQASLASSSAVMRPIREVSGNRMLHRRPSGS